VILFSVIIVFLPSQNDKLTESVFVKSVSLAKMSCGKFFEKSTKKLLKNGKEKKTY